MLVGEEDITWCRTTRGPFFGENGAMMNSSPDLPRKRYSMG